MSRIQMILVLTVVFLGGCASQTVKIVSIPSGAEVYANQDRIGSTPLLASIYEIMPLADYNGTIARTVITLKKAGYEDFIVNVNKFYMPSEIKASLVPISVTAQKINSNVINTKESIENRLSVLKQLLDNGTITKEEFENKRKEILGGL